MADHHTTLISAAELQALQASQQPHVLLDCSFDLADPAAGERAYREGHLPGALYVNLDHDLSGDKTDHNRGRHPLPARHDFAATAGRLGIAPGVQVVTYDAQGGPYAARAWWLLRWLGHDAVAVLDGGAAAWQQAGGTLSAVEETAETAETTDSVTDDTTSTTPPYPASAMPAMPTVDASALLQQLGQHRVLDARAPDRFRGEVEPLDPVAGHIPGATNRFFKDNLQRDGSFKPAAELREDFEALGISSAEGVVQQCGSGVTACHNLLAMAHAGMGDSTLYPGSWSDWCSDPARPVARG